jgi:hypothetical protein
MQAGAGLKGTAAAALGHALVAAAAEGQPGQAAGGTAAAGGSLRAPREELLEPFPAHMLVSVVLALSTLTSAVHHRWSPEGHHTMFTGILHVQLPLRMHCCRALLKAQLRLVQLPAQAAAAATVCKLCSLRGVRQRQVLVLHMCPCTRATSAAGSRTGATNAALCCGSCCSVSLVAICLLLVAGSPVWPAPANSAAAGAGRRATAGQVGPALQSSHCNSSRRSSSCSRRADAGCGSSTSWRCYSPARWR